MECFLGLESRYTGYKDSKVVIVPVPFEQTTSYVQGTRKGPEAIIEASSYVELYDEELDKEIYPLGIHTATSLLFNEHIEDDFQLITDHFIKILDDKKFAVALGGEHSISFPIIRAFIEKYKNLSVLQLDAHADLRDEYENSRYSHACVMRRVTEITENIVQLGIRSLSSEEAQFIKDRSLYVAFAHELKRDGFQKELIEQLKPDVYITIDMDFFDPSVIPSTGTPEPGGFFWNETMDFLKEVFTKRNVVGFDVVELSPMDGLVHPDFFAAKMIYKLLGYKFADQL